METTIHPPEEERSPFWHTKLPLLLIPIVLIVFNYFLYTRLQADAIVANEADTSAEMVESAENTVVAAELVPQDGVNLRPIAGTLDGTGWRVIRGNWIAEEAGLRQTTTDAFDLAISYEAQRFDTYAFDVVMRHLDKIGGGVYINMQSADSTAASHMIRFETDGSALFWGYFDEDAGFTGQGFANVALDLAQPHALRVAVHNDAYDIFLDGQLLVEAIPLQYRGGHVGLMATEADVLFEDVNIVPIDGVGTAPAVVDDLLPEGDTLLEQLATFSGNWVYENGTIRQTETDGTDYITMLNTLGTGYTLQATVTLPKHEVVPDAGAGFIFHMPQRDSRALGHMIRLVDGGEQMVWGAYDANGDFIGNGNVAVNLEPDVPHDIAVRVSGTQFDILVNGEELVTELPLTNEEGWIGLLAYRGVVTFSDVNLTLGGN